MKRNSVLVTAMMIFCCMSLCFSQSGFMKIGDIDGEASDRDHKDWIIVESVSLGMSQPQRATGTTRRPGSVKLEDLVIHKKVDKSSPRLLEACAKGQVFPKLELELVSANGQTYYKVTLNRVRISSVRTQTDCDPDCQVFEEVAINYTKITWEYTDSAGNKTTRTYNAQENN